MTRLGCWLLAASIVSPVDALAQSPSVLEKLTKRLDEMEESNRKLNEELQALRQELSAYKASSDSPAAAPQEERLKVQEQRTTDLAQTKVEASQKFPLAITGMLLFNAFHNGRSGNSQYPVVASSMPGQSFSGASVRQTVLGLTFDGPQLPFGGKATGSLYMDFDAGSATSENQLLHIRLATLDLNWRNTSITVGQDKPIVSPREPDSLAQVAVSPLTGAGNLWSWEPQVRVEQRFSFGENSGIRAQAGIYQTYERDSSVPGAFASSLARARPGYEGRFEFWHRSGTRRFEIAPGFHESATHVAGTSVASNAFTLDWLVRPAAAVQVTGAWFRGQNLASLGTLRQGFTVISAGNAIPVHSVGGWAQVALFPERRASVHFYGGQHRDRQRDLRYGGITRNEVYAGNIFYRFAPNILGSFEASQTRTRYVNVPTRLNNHYDLAVAYLF